MITSTRWRRVYVVKEMTKRDFSGVTDISEEVIFLYKASESRMNAPFDELASMIEEELATFDPSCDLLLLAGPSTACALAFACLLEKHGEVPVAVFKDGVYEFFRAQSWSKIHLGDTSLAVDKISERANV